MLIQGIKYEVKSVWDRLKVGQVFITNATYDETLGFQPDFDNPSRQQELAWIGIVNEKFFTLERGWLMSESPANRQIPVGQAKLMNEIIKRILITNNLAKFVYYGNYKFNSESPGWVIFISGEGVVTPQTREMTKPLRETKTIKEIKKMSRTKAIELKIVRAKGHTILNYEIAPEISKMYEELSGGKVKESTKWPNLEFYLVEDLLKNEEYQDRLNSYKLIDSFGDSLIYNGRLNIAWLRTKGGKGSLEVGSEVPLSQLITLSKNTISFLRDYFSEVLLDFEITGAVETKSNL